MAAPFSTRPESAGSIFRSRHAGPGGLSSLFRVQLALRLLLVGLYDGDVADLDGVQEAVLVVRIRSVPGLAREVALQPFALERSAVARIDLVAQPQRVLRRQARQHLPGDRLGGQRLVQARFPLEDGGDVLMLDER